MKEIGGYFELELRKGAEYHSEAIRLNTGRNAFEHILREKGYKKIYIPYYTCDVLLEPLRRLELKYEYYHIDENLEPVFQFDLIGNDEGFLYTNYFGLKDKFITTLAKTVGNLIIDSVQSFFSNPLKGIDTFYSARKFFGVPDGAYVYLNSGSNSEFEKDISVNRLEHLTSRIEFGAEHGYASFIENDKFLKNQPIKTMSNLTRRMLESIDYEGIKTIRNNNFYFLHEIFSENNLLNFDLKGDESPMIYPLLVNIEGIKEYLINNKVFVATYWKEVNDKVRDKSFEFRMTNYMLPLPIDQRYSIDDLKIITKLLKGKII
jgi:hypothetical protein